MCSRLKACRAFLVAFALPIFAGVSCGGGSGGSASQQEVTPIPVSSAFAVSVQAASTSPAAVYQQDANTGLLSMEAEHADANISPAGYEWVVDYTPGYSGDSALRAWPHWGGGQKSDYSQTSPRLDYAVNFARTGTHYIWVRGLADRGSDNSVHVGQDGAEVPSSEGIDFPVNNAWTWVGGAGVASFEVQTAGSHTVNVWMRESGFRFDKLVVTTDAAFVPSGAGPAESPREVSASSPNEAIQAQVDPYAVVVESVGGGVFSVSGGAGTVDARQLVRIANPRLSDEVLVAPQADGSFTATVAAAAEDLLELVVTDGAGNDGPATELYAGAYTIKNPYTTGGHWYVGQGHTHTLRSDGRDSPQALEAAYYDAGYDFVVSTDHRGTAPWSEAGLTPDPNNSATGKDLLWIRGSELGFGKVHMGAWGQRTSVPMDDTMTLQDQIDTVRSLGGVTVMNHPENRTPPYAWDWNTEINVTRGYSMVEAFNGLHPAEREGSEHKVDAVDLADDYRQVWWIGTDDCHNINDPLQFNQYAIVVQTDSPVITQADVLSSADAGDMYIRETVAGPEITAVETAGNTITVRLADVGANYNVVWKKRGDEIVKQELVDTASSYVVQGNEGYVRAEIERVDDGLMAYIQPLFIGDSRDLSVSATASTGSGALNLVDNIGSTLWDAGAGTASFVIDVGSVRQVNAIRIDWLDSDARRFNYRVDASETGAFSGEEVEVVRPTHSNRSAKTIDFFDVYARYIRVTATSQSVGTGATVVVREVEVFDASPDGTELYIDNVSGDNANSGLAGSPWRTFDFSRDKVRPRDTLNFVNTGVPFGGMMELREWNGGKHPNAIVRYRGDTTSLTGIDATGVSYGVRFLGTKHVEWSYFDIYGAKDGNILVYGGTDKSATVVKYNRLRDSQSRGIRASGDLTLAYNLIHGNAGQGAFLYIDGVEAGIYNNVFYGNQSGLVLPSYDLDVDVRNNIFSGNTGAALYQTSRGTVTDSHNCVDGAYVGGWQRSSSIEAPPLFVDPTNGDFRLQGASPCIDAGIDLNLAPDFAGNSPFDAAGTPNSGSAGDYSRDYLDIGAYEFIQ